MKRHMNIVVTGHDAGGAQLLLHFIKAHYQRANWIIVAPERSPFAKIVRQLGVMLKQHVTMKQSVNMKEADALFFSTSWQQKSELPWLQVAKEQNVTSVAFLDHYSYYRERFTYESGTMLPDATVVSDRQAKRIAIAANLPHIIMSSNYYLLAEQVRLKGLRAEQPSLTSKRLLFFSEPTKEVAQQRFGDARYWGFTQEDVLEHILQNFQRFGCEELDIRLHPSEASHAYDAVLRRYPTIRARTVMASQIELCEQIISSAFCIGLDTMALISAALADVPYLSYLPLPNEPNAVTREFLLPLPRSHQLRSLEAYSPLQNETEVCMELFRVEQFDGTFEAITALCSNKEQTA